MSAAAELQTAIYQALIADADVGSLVGDRIYDNVPTDRVFPYVSFGPTQEITDDEQGIDGEEHFVQIDVWDRSDARLSPAKRIVSAVKAALHDVSLTLPDPYALAFMRVRDTRTMRDSDGKTAHGIVSIVAMVEI